MEATPNVWEGVSFGVLRVSAANVLQLMVTIQPPPPPASARVSCSLRASLDLILASVSGFVLSMLSFFTFMLIAIA
jgi:hypothetical protein